MKPSEKDGELRTVEWIVGLGPARMRASADCITIHMGISVNVGLASYSLAGLFGIHPFDSTSLLASILGQAGVSAVTLWIWRVRWNRLEKAGWATYESTDA